MKKFRPQERFLGYNSKYNWKETSNWYPKNTINKKWIVDLFGKLHYLSCHAPKVIQNKNQKVYNRFRKHYLPYSNYKYTNWINKYTPRGWL